MRLIPSFLRRKKRELTISSIPQPRLWLSVCDNCGHRYWSANVEGNRFPYVCLACGKVRDQS
jgi:hypothetical protein